jgi:hypothetical protein
LNASLQFWRMPQVLRRLSLQLRNGNDGDTQPYHVTVNLDSSKIRGPFFALHQEQQRRQSSEPFERCGLSWALSVERFAFDGCAYFLISLHCLSVESCRFLAALSGARDPCYQLIGQKIAAVRLGDIESSFKCGSTWKGICVQVMVMLQRVLERFSRWCNLTKKRIPKIGLNFRSPSKALQMVTLKIENEMDGRLLKHGSSVMCVVIFVVHFSLHHIHNVKAWSSGESLSPIRTLILGDMLV